LWERASARRSHPAPPNVMAASPHKSHFLPFLNLLSLRSSSVHRSQINARHGHLSRGGHRPFNQYALHALSFYSLWAVAPELTLPLPQGRPPTRVLFKPNFYYRLKYPMPHATGLAIHAYVYRYPFTSPQVTSKPNHRLDLSASVTGKVLTDCTQPYFTRTCNKLSHHKSNTQGTHRMLCISHCAPRAADRPAGGSPPAWRIVMTPQRPKTPDNFS
jgi:hypothetical protein